MNIITMLSTYELTYCTLESYQNFSVYTVSGIRNVHLGYSHGFYLGTLQASLF